MTVAPEINLDFKTDWCPRHLGPFHPKWPAHAAEAMIALVYAFAEDPRTIEDAEKTDDGLAKAESLPALIAEHKPLCCFVGDTAMQLVYRKAGLPMRHVVIAQTAAAAGEWCLQHPEIRDDGTRRPRYVSSEHLLHGTDVDTVIHMVGNWRSKPDADAFEAHCNHHTARGGIVLVWP